MKTQTSNWWMTVFHLEWILVFMILLLGWFLVSPDSLLVRPIMAMYALFAAVATYVVVRLLHRRPTEAK